MKASRVKSTGKITTRKSVVSKKTISVTMSASKDKVQNDEVSISKGSFKHLDSGKKTKLKSKTKSKESATKSSKEVGHTAALESDQRLNYDLPLQMTEQTQSSSKIKGTWKDESAEDIEGYLMTCQRKFIKYRLNIFLLNKVSCLSVIDLTSSYSSVH